MILAYNDEPIHYNDRPLRFIAAFLATHYLVVYGIDIPLFKMMKGWDYWISLFASLPLAIIQIEYVAFITRRLDKKFPWTRDLTKRSLIQAFWGVVVPGMIEFLLGLAYFTIRERDVFDTFFYTNDYPLAMLMIIVVNFYYVTFFFIKKYFFAKKHIEVLTNTVASLQENTSEDDAVQLPATFAIQRGPVSIPILQEEIAYFFRDGEANFLKTATGESIFINLTLDDIERVLDINQFFRANRQTIVNYTSVQKWSNIENGKLEIKLEPAYQGQVVISQKRAKEFKQWYKLQEVIKLAKARA